jgi:hypothetical protein
MLDVTDEFDLHGDDIFMHYHFIFQAFYKPCS